jgi:hypothetical protein
MHSHTWKTLISTVTLGLLFGVFSTARAQYGFDGAPGFPSAGQQNGSFSTPFGGFGWSGYGSNPEGLSVFGSVGYGLSGNGGNFSDISRFGMSFAPNAVTFGPGTTLGGTQAQISFRPSLGVVTVVPGWKGTSHRTRRRSAQQTSSMVSRPFDSAGKTTSSGTLHKDTHSTPVR